MATNFGFTKQNNNLKEEIKTLEKKIQDLDARRKQNKTAIISLTTLVATKSSYTTVFDLNVKTASISMPNLPRLDVNKLQQGSSVLTQNKSWNYPDVALDHVINDSFNFLHFPCPELMFTNVSVFVILEALTTVATGAWCYIFGNDNGSYDKFLGYKANTLNKLCFGGSYPVKKNECTLPSGFNVKTKHLLSIHWLMLDSCLYANGTKISGSDFLSNYKSKGEPYGTLFYNDRIPSGSAAANTVFTGKIYGMKIIVGPMTSSHITLEHQNLITEYNITV